jgi:hypothetical protein
MAGYRGNDQTSAEEGSRKSRQAPRLKGPGLAQCLNALNRQFILIVIA